MKKRIKFIQYTIPKTEMSAEDISDKILLLLQSLKTIDENLFSQWNEQAWSKKKSMEKKVVFSKEYLLKIVSKSWDKQFPDLGTHFVFWTGKIKDAENSDISISLGKIDSNKNLFNTITIKFPSSEEIQIFKDDERIKKISATVRELWNYEKLEFFQI